jgi:alpha-1,2-mannosyltransferase
VDTLKLAMGLVSFLLSLLVLYIVKRAILPLSLKWLGRLVGYRLRRASQTRQELLWARTADERRAYEEAHCKDSSTKKELEDWEEVDPARVGSAVNGGDLRPGWQGVVGFFHPFW